MLKGNWAVSDNKMKKIVIGALLVFLMSSAFPVYAQYGYTSGAYEELDAGRSYFQRMSDWFATVGKSREEKALIKSRRRTTRKINNAKKAIARKKKEIAKKKRQLKKQAEIRKRKIK